MLVPIDLDSGDPVDDQVDATAVGHQNLRHHDVTAQTKARACEALGQGFAIRVHPIADPAALDRQTEDESLKVDDVELPGMECPIDRSDGHLQLFVENNPLKGIHKPGSTDGSWGEVGALNGECLSDQG